ELIWQRLVVPMEGGQPDEAKIAAAVPKVREQLAILDAALKTNPFLAGTEPSLADLLLFPILFYVKATPEGQEGLPQAPAVKGWFGRMAGRPSVAASDPTRG